MRGLLLILVVIPVMARADWTRTVSPAGRTEAGEITLAQAIAELRASRQAGDRQPADILLRGGFHCLTDPIDADLAGDGLTLCPTNPESEFPVISAGRVVRDWEAHNGIWSTKLDFDPSALFVNHKPATRARMPNNSYWRIERSGADRRTSFTWQPDTIPPVSATAGLDLVFLHDWSISRIPVKSLDPATRTLTTVFPIGPNADHYKIDHYEKQPRYFLEGSRDFLDAPGEWHYDRVEKSLRYIPRPGEKLGASLAVVCEHPLAVVLKGSAEKPLRNVLFSGISFAHAGWQPPGGRYAAGQASFHEDGQSHTRTPVPCMVEGDFCENLRFEFCRFQNAATGGLWIRQQCRDVTIDQCVFADLGANGIMIGEPHAREKVTTKVTVENCDILRCGQRFFGAVGLWIGMAADCTVRGCRIRDLPYTGISVGWRWDDTPSPCKGHRIEDNGIHDIMRVLSDGAGIYTLGRQPGTVLCGNHIHGVAVNAGRAESNGIFMDEGSSGILVEDNHIHDIARSPIRFHKAGENLLRRNRLRPASGIPPLRFNNTPEKNITVEDIQ
jgi:hypothetical protein